MNSKNNIQVAFSPELFEYYNCTDSITVIVDIFRATSSICTAFENGVKEIIPTPNLDEARKLKEKGYIVAAERDGKVLDFADFGNSPFNFTPERVKGKSVAYSTTNGTKAILKANESKMVIISSFINLTATANLISRNNFDVIILCAGWKGNFCLEDSIFAGALAEKLLDTGLFSTNCDSAKASLDLWRNAKDDIIGYIDKTAQRKRLAKLGLDDILDYCFTPDSSNVVPFYHKGTIEAYNL
ncbi:MAG: 2-phosphosulfolactate phosphatase [Bacteroidales bacterium]